jgi:hypothetical protein
MGRSQVIYNRITAKIRAERNGDRGDERDIGSRRRSGSEDGRRAISTNFVDDDENDDNNNDDDSRITNKRATSAGLPPFSPSSRSLQQRHGNNQFIVKHGRARDVFRRSQQSDDSDYIDLNSSSHHRPKTPVSTVDDEADALLSLENQSRYQYMPNQSESTPSSLLLGARRYYSTNSFDQGTPSSSRNNTRRPDNNSASSSRHQYHGLVDTGMPSSAEQVNAMCKRMGETLQCVPAVDQWRISPHLVETMYSASERRRQQMKLDEWKNSMQLKLQSRTPTKFCSNDATPTVQSGGIVESNTADVTAREGFVSSDTARSRYTLIESVSSTSNAQQSSLVTQDEDDFGSHLLQEVQLSTASSDFEPPSVFLEPSGPTSLISINRKKYDSSDNSSVRSPSAEAGNNILQSPQQSVKTHDLEGVSNHNMKLQVSCIGSGNTISQAAHRYEAPTQAWINYQEQQSSHHLNTPKASPLARKSLTSISRPPPSPSIMTINTPNNSNTVVTPVRTMPVSVSSTGSTNSELLTERSFHRIGAATHQSGILRSPSSISSVTQPVVTFVEEAIESIESVGNSRYHQINVIDAELASSANGSTSSAMYITGGTSSTSYGSAATEAITNRSRHTSPRAHNGSTTYSDNNHSYTSSTIASESTSNRRHSNSESNRILYSNSGSSSTGSNHQGRAVNSLTTTVTTTLQPTTVGGRLSPYQQHVDKRRSSSCNDTDIINVEDLTMHLDLNHQYQSGRQHPRKDQNIDLVPIIVLDDMSSSIQPQSTEDTMDKWLEGALQTQSSNTTTTDDDFDQKQHLNINIKHNESENDNELDSWLDSVIS